MKLDDLELEPRITAAVRRGQRFSSVSEVFGVSVLDLQRFTGLSRADVQQLTAAAAASCRRRPPVPALLLHRGECGGLASGLRLAVGCPVLDELLRGGLPVGGVTELSGESGAGKTQLALQLCLCVQFPTQHGGLNSGAVYICTEDTFPMRRLRQLITEQPRLRTDVPPSLISSLCFTDHIYIEHAADLDSLSVCLSRRVPLLLARGLVRLVVVDSVAALFRAEFQADDWLQRNKQLLALAATLQHLSDEFNTPVLCINQVTDVFNSSDRLSPVMSQVSPALGLAWANQLMVRLMLLRLQGVVAQGDQRSALRRLEVVFAPHLDKDGRDAAVWREGVRGVCVCEQRTSCQ
ncbi:DNA repair protein XRCC3 isoform X1 [Solea solea]|uniref:DNA repair protein XRCC3 isoform X1 n=1 Tax=Solea solea TaxID=90069 RepID=UPI00272D0764|nr:DNA repair protein XRCC3 isoform X1 [Solea solea]